jgi:hypothetical protein
MVGNDEWRFKSALKSERLGRSSLTLAQVTWNLGNNRLTIGSGGSWVGKADTVITKGKLWTPFASLITPKKWIQKHTRSL